MDQTLKAGDQLTLSVTEEQILKKEKRVDVAAKNDTWNLSFDSAEEVQKPPAHMLW